MPLNLNKLSALTVAKISKPGGHLSRPTARRAVAPASYWSWGWTRRVRDVGD
jgi:hypothetical protein